VKLEPLNIVNHPKNKRATSSQAVQVNPLNKKEAKKEQSNTKADQEVGDIVTDLTHDTLNDYIQEAIAE